MHPQNPLFAIAGFLMAFAFATVVYRVTPPLPDGQREYSIDGLRGYLAFGVVLHHSFIWYVYLRTGDWVLPQARLYAHLGESSVALFFMITAFLFTRKILDERASGVDWRRLFVGRLFRLMPLYALMVILLCAVVLVATGFRLMVPLDALALSIARWAALGSYGQPPINGLTNTWHVVAGVVWTLRYEVLFYAALPLLSALLGGRRAWGWIGFGAAVTLSILACVALSADDRLEPGKFFGFGFGIAAAYTARRPAFRRFARSRAADVAIVALVAPALMTGGVAAKAVGTAAFGVAFLLISAGADLFGLLQARASRFLGEISYGIYLLHGIALYVVFDGLIGRGARDLAAWQHWAIALVTALAVLVGATAAHFLIEKPGIAAGRAFGRGGRVAPAPEEAATSA